MKSLVEFLAEALVSNKAKLVDDFKGIILDENLSKNIFNHLDKTQLTQFKEFLRGKYHQNGFTIVCSDLCLHIHRYEDFKWCQFAILTAKSEQWPKNSDDWKKSFATRDYSENIRTGSGKTMFDEFCLVYEKYYDKIISYICESEQLSDVETNWHPEEGLFTKDAEYIVSYLRKHSKDDTQAMRRLVFYMNRAGDDVSNKTELNKAVELLKK